MTIAHVYRRCRCATMLAALALLAVAFCAAPAAYAQQNLVYVISNISTAGQNAVQGFVNDGLGNLTPLPGSPYATGGTGTGPSSDGTDFQWDSDGEIAINAAGTLMFVVNGGSNNISEFTINADGSLTAVSGSPFDSGGQDPASVAFKDNVFPNNGSFLVVVNKDSDPNQTGGTPNYTTFTVDSSGVATMNPGSTYNLPSGSTPAQAMMRPNGRVEFFGVEFLNSTLSTYKTNGHGILTQVSSSTPPVTNPMVLGGVMHPTQKGMYVALPVQRQISVYSYDSLGNLTYRKSVPNLGGAVCWLAINAAGTRLYSSETPTSTMTVYNLNNPLKPTKLQHLSFTTSGLPAHMKLDPTGKFLYVVDRTGSLRVLDVASDGTVTDTRPMVSLNLPANTTPLGLAVLTK